MILEPIFYNVNDWNQDGLSLAGAPNPYLGGTKSIISLDSSMGPPRGLAYVDPAKIAILHPSTKQLEIVALAVDKSVVHHLKEAIRPIHIAASIRDNSLYVLDAGKNAVLHVDQEGITAIWPLGVELTDESRIARCIPGNTDLLFLGPTIDGRLSLFQPENPCEVVQFAVQDLSGEHIALRPGAHFWADLRNLSLFVPDQSRHVLLEVNVSYLIDSLRDTNVDSSPKVCEVLQTYGDHEGVIGVGQGIENLAFQCPGPMAVYRPDGFPLKKFLSAPAKRLVDQSSSRIYPRSILVADSVSRRVQKIIEFGPESIYPSRVVTMLGSGDLPEDQVYEINTAPEEDMRRWAIQPVEDMILSDHGQLCLLLGADSVLVLTPATARRENMIFAQSGEIGDWGRS
jgi:hypothetical protein